MINLYQGDCLDQLKLIPDNSTDSIVTDPPYGLSFMGKKWDYDVPSVEIWKEVLRVLKPGGHLLSFGGTRTYHRMVLNIEDAGFEIRDQIMWIYGSGFPKSQNIALAIDKQSGAIGNRGKAFQTAGAGDRKDIQNTSGLIDGGYREAITTLAKQWQGWGTALKPANEPICLARKPISEKTVASNVLKHGTGAMNIDESRVGSESLTYTSRLSSNKNLNDDNWSKIGKTMESTTSQGRWPANVIFDDFSEEVLLLKDNLPELVYKLIKEYFHDYSEMSDLRKKYSDLPEQDKQNEILQQGLLCKTVEASSASDVGQKAQLENKKENEQGQTVICKERQGESEIQRISHDSGISNDSHTRSSKKRSVKIQRDVPKGLLCRASLSDGQEFGETTGIKRSGSPHEWSQKRQSNTEPRASLCKLSQEGALGSDERANSTKILIRESDVPKVWREYFTPSGLEVRSNHSAGKILDEQSGMLKSGGHKAGSIVNSNHQNNAMAGKLSSLVIEKEILPDSGGASRFFYCAKTSKTERNAGLEGMPLHDQYNEQKATPNRDIREQVKVQNFHPTVKPIKLMTYLIKLITPPGGVVLDPFMGSGSTGVAAKQLGFKFVGIERDEAYFEIAKNRIKL